MANGAGNIGNAPDEAGGGADQAPPPGPGSAPTPGPGAAPMQAFLGRQQQGPQPSAPGPGDQANSMTLIMNAISMLQQAMGGLGPGSPQHRDVVRAVSTLSRHVAQGQPAAGVQRTQLVDMLRNLGRNALMAKIMQQQGGQQGGQGGPGGGGGQPPAPMPSTPLPGA